MQHLARVKVADSAEELQVPELNLCLWKMIAGPPLYLNLLLQVTTIAVVHDDAEEVTIDKRLTEARQVRVGLIAHHLHQVDLSQDDLRVHHLS